MSMTHGHNSRDLTENERKSLFFHHLRKRSAHNTIIAAANAEKKADAKLAQHDEIVIGDLDYAIKAIGADEKVTVTDRYFAQGEVLSWLNLVPGFQPDLLRDRAPAIERIEGEGELAGLAGKDAKSPYDLGSNEDLAWLRGWSNGQAIMRDNLESAMNKINATMEDGDPGFANDNPHSEAAE
jgi:ribosome modulation factor